MTATTEHDEQFFGERLECGGHEEQEVPWLDPGVVSAVLECEPAEGRRLYDLLARHSFAERHPRGLRIHDKIRDLLRDRLRFTDPARYADVTARLDAYFARRELQAREESGGAV